MAVVYRHWAAEIGAFEGSAHVVRVADLSESRSLRHAALELLEALVAPVGSRGRAGVIRDFGAAIGSAEGEVASHGALAEAGGKGRALGSASGAVSERACRAAAANARSVMEAGGMELMTAVAAEAHGLSATSSGSVAGVALLSDSAHVEPPRVWTLRLPPGAAEDARRRLGLPAEIVRGEGEEGGDGLVDVGPLLRAEVLQLARWGLAEEGTAVSADGLGEGERLGGVRELRWALCEGSGLMTPEDEVLLGLRVITALCATHR